MSNKQQTKKQAAPLKLRVQAYNQPRKYRVVSGRGRSFRIHADGFATEAEARAALSQ